MYKDEIAPYLAAYFASLDESKLSRVLRYAVEGGKGIRGFIVKHILETLGGPEAVRWEPIAAVELIHSASLTLDDLPSMDNDSMRRGKPSTFKAFGENEAILSTWYVGSEAIRILFHALCSLPYDKEDPYSHIRGAIDWWSELIGRRIVVGQLLDLKDEAAEYFGCAVVPTGGELCERIIEYKTCSLFSFAFILGAIFSGKGEYTDDFRLLGQHFGMMYQLMDDYVDRDHDKQRVNYILNQGKDKACLKYMTARTAFIGLLQKYALLTERFMELIEAIDNKFGLGASKGSSVSAANHT